MLKRITTLTLFSCLFSGLMAQPQLVIDLNAGASDGFEEFYYHGIPFGDAYLLPGNDGVLGRELYQLKNGSLTLLKDLNPGMASGEPQRFVQSNGLIYFSAKDENSTVTLWQTDGTTAGTQQVAATAALPLTNLIMANNGGIYLETGEKVCYFDPIGGTATVLTNSPGDLSFTPDYNSVGAKVCTLGNGIVFVVAGNQFIDFWKAEGTVLTKIHSMATPGFFTKVYGLTPLGNDFLFTLDNSVYPDASGLYVYRSATNTTTRIVNATSDEGKVPRRMKAFSDTKVIFMDGTKIYATDGTVSGTIILTYAVPGLYGGQEWNTSLYNGKMIFEGPESFFDVSILVTNGTPSGTSMVATTEEPFISPMINYQGHVWWASGTSNGFEPTIWHTDLSLLSSNKLYSYSGSSGIKSIIPVTIQGNKLYFFSTMGGIGRELYSLTVSQNTETSELTTKSAPYQFVQRGNRFSIELAGEISAPVQVKLYAADGREVRQFNLLTNEFAEIGYLPAGVYFYQISGKEGMVADKFFQAER